MREQTARLVYPVFRRGLVLKECLRHGQLNMAHEQAELTKLIKAADAAMPRPAPGGPEEGSLGVGYPLACWLDEVFILDPDSPWKVDWNEKALEFALYNTRDRAWKFWAQAQLGPVRSDPDVLEVFYLCVMLGFRGDRRDDPGGLQDWRQTAETLLGRGRPADWPDKPPELALPPPDVPPRRSRERLLWVLLAYAFVGGAAILVTAFSVLSVFW
jgi:type VI secretion system protein ImpK